MLAGSIITQLAVDTGGVTASARTGRTPADVSIVAAIARQTSAGTASGPHRGGGDSDPGGAAKQSPTSSPTATSGGVTEYRRHLAETLARRAIEQLGEQIMNIELTINGDVSPL